MTTFSQISDLIPRISPIEIIKKELLRREDAGEIYKGVWNGRSVAIKQLLIQNSDQLKAAFSSEANILASCQSERIVKLLALCEDPGNYALMLEFVDQRSLEDILQDQKIELLWETHRLRIAIDIGRGVSYLHDDKNIVHGALQSSNILIDRDFHAKITNFSSAKLKNSAKIIPSFSQNMRWRAPEIFEKNAEHTPASNIYSYGMLLWEIASRAYPYKELTDPRVEILIKSGTHEKLREEWPSLYQQQIRNSWKKEPEKRPSAKSIVLELEKMVPKKCWQADPQTQAQADFNGKKYALIPASPKELETVKELYKRHPVPGFEIKSVLLIENPTLEKAFIAHMEKLQARQNLNAFIPEWTSDGEVEWRKKVLQLFESISRPYIDPDFPAVKLLPLWHGTFASNIEGICSTGFASLGKTDHGFFGKGYYFTYEAEYAYRVYSVGALLLNWTAVYSAYPVINGDVKDLEGKTFYQNYDARFIPAVPRNALNENEGSYDACKPNQRHVYTELFLSESAACLPRYLVVLQPISSIATQAKALTQTVNLPEHLDHFIERSVYNSHLEEILRQWVQETKIITLYGVKGCGKSELAIHFAYQNFQKFSYIFWINSASKLESWRSIAVILRIDVKDLSESELINAVCNKLESLSSTYPWLLVLDAPAALGCLPTKGGIVLALSKHPYDDSRQDQTLEILNYTREEALAFLTKTLGKQNENLSLILIDKLGYLPAFYSFLTQYLQNQKISLEVFLSDFEKHIQNILRSVNHVRYPHSLLEVGKSLFSDLKSRNEKAFEWLHLLAYLAPEPFSSLWCSDLVQQDKPSLQLMRDLSASGMLKEIKASKVKQDALSFRFQHKNSHYLIYPLMRQLILTIFEDSQEKQIDLVLEFLRISSEKILEQEVFPTAKHQEWLKHANWVIKTHLQTSRMEIQFIKDLIKKLERKQTLAQIRENGLLLIQLPQEYQEDEEFVGAAIAQNKQAFRMVTSKKVAQRFILERNELFPLLADALHKDPHFMSELLAVDGLLLKYMHNHTQDEPILLAALKQTHLALSYVPPFFRTQDEFLMKAIKLNKQNFCHISNMTQALSMIAKDETLLLYASQHFQKNKKFIIEVVKQNGLLLEHVHPTFKCDEEVVEVATAQNPEALRYTTSREIAFKCVSKNGWLLRFIPAEFRDKNMLASAAISTSENLKISSLKIIDRVNDQLNILVERLLPTEEEEGLLSDVNDILAEVRKNGLALSHYTDKLSIMENQEILIAAVKNNSEAFKYVPIHLQMSISFVVSCMEVNPTVYYYLSKDFQRDKRILTLKMPSQSHTVPSRKPENSLTSSLNVFVNNISTLFNPKPKSKELLYSELFSDSDEDLDYTKLDLDDDSDYEQSRKYPDPFASDDEDAFIQTQSKAKILINEPPGKNDEQFLLDLIKADPTLFKYFPAKLQHDALFLNKCIKSNPAFLEVNPLLKEKHFMPSKNSASTGFTSKLSTVWSNFKGEAHEDKKLNIFISDSETDSFDQEDF